ncbi:MAG: 50S ribosomal protein L38e [Candidatus Atabeyarchaeum deiterrae]|jgi:large subunit ribosomal protein L38e
MPRELREEEVDKFVQLSKEAAECRVKRVGEVVKLKLRTNKYMYTIKLKPEKAEEIVKKLGCSVVET